MRLRIKLPARRSDVAALSVIQVGTYIVPLILVPFYTRVLGQRGWGSLAVALGLSLMVQYVVEYGFQYSLAVEVAKHGWDPPLRASLLTRVLVSRAVIAAVSGIAILAFAPLLVKPIGGSTNLALAFFSGALLGFNFTWLMRPLGLISINASVDTGWRVIGAVATLGLVRPGGITIALLIQLLASVGNVATQATAAHFRAKLYLLPITASDVLKTLLNGASMATYVVFVLAYTSANVLLVGLLSGQVAAGVFAGAERIARAASGLLQPLVQATFGLSAQLAGSNPRAAAVHVRAILRTTVVAGVCFSLGLLAGASILVRLVFGADYADARTALIVLAPLPLLLSISNPLGLQWMVLMNQQRRFLLFVGIAGATNILLAVLLCPRLGAVGMSCAVLLSETVITVLMIVSAARSEPSPITSRKDGEVRPGEGMPVSQPTVGQ